MPNINNIYIVVCFTIDNLFNKLGKIHVSLNLTKFSKFV
jgi:hypothetical protein